MLCVGTVPSAHRADRSCLAPRAPACVGSSAVLQDTWGLGCLPHTFVAEQQEVPLAASGGSCPPVLCPSSPCRQLGPWVPQLPCALCQARAALGEPCPQLFYIPSALVSVTVQITCYNKPTSPILQGTVVFLR